MSRAPDIPRLVNFSDSDMSTDSDSDIDSNTATRGNSQNSLIVDSDRSDLSEIVGDPVKSSGKTDYFSKEGAREIHKEECQSRFSGNLIQSKYGGKTGEVKYGEGSSRDKRSGSIGRRSRSWGRRSGSGGRRSESRGSRRSESRGRRSESRDRRSCSRDKRSGSRGRKSSSRDRSRSRGRRSSSGYRRSRSRGRRSSSRGRGGRSRSRSRDRRRRSRSGSRGRYRRSRSGSRGKYRRSRSGSRRRRDRRHSSPRRALRRSPPRAHRTLDTLEKLGIELKPAAPPEEPQPAIPSYYNRMAVNPTKYAQQMAKRKLIWGSKTNEEGTAKASTWQGATFSQDQDGKMTAKFKRLMGIKGEETATTSVGEGKGQELIKRQQELFSSMELQYEAARQATHTQRGVGLGFSSHPHHFPS